MAENLPVAESAPSTSSAGATPPRAASRRQEPLLVEVAWEACNQIGGIYTVLRSKAPAMVERWGMRYCLLGPINDKSVQVEFEDSPLTGAFGEAARQLQEAGIPCRYGRWLITGRPQIVLIDFRALFGRLGDIKYRLWKDHDIGTPGDDGMVNDVIAFGEATRIFLQILAYKQASRRRIVAHFHEWMAGACVPMLRKEGWAGAMCFTTHATLLGRYLAFGDNFYDHLPHYDHIKEAARFGIEPRHRLERAAAHGCNVFTTVSDVTALECTYLLGRTPDLVTPNGLNIARFERLHDLQNLHRQYKERIHEFTMGHFFPSYSFDLDKTLYFFTSGRYEYRNKGYDLVTESLARLNHRLRNSDCDKTVVCFFVTSRPVRSMNVQALQSRAMLEEFQYITDEIKNQVGKALFEAASRGQTPSLDSLVDEYWKLRLRRTMAEWKRGMPPTIVTHDVVDDAKDDILNGLRRCYLWNQPHDRVKVVYHPEFIKPTNPLWGIEYDQFVRGCHLGVFPSYYEPWGYTPLESIASGVPALASDLSGFGSYVAALNAGHHENGMFVVRRRGRSFDQAADEMTETMFRFCAMDRRERIELRNRVEAFAQHFAWRKLVRYYHEAHDKAIAWTGGDIVGE